jgi:hypothetical protein
MIEEMFKVVFSMRSMLRLRNEQQLWLRDSPGMAVRRVGGWHEMAASLGMSCKTDSEEREHGSYDTENRYWVTTGEDTAD